MSAIGFIARFREWAVRSLGGSLGNDRAFNEMMQGSSNISTSGEAVSLLKAVGFPALRQGITLISGDVAKVQCGPYRMNVDGSSEIDRGHKAFRTTAWRPNPKQSAYTFWRHMMIHALLWTHAYAWIRRLPDGSIELYPLLSDRTEKRVTEDGEIIYASEINGRIETFFESEIFHLSGMHIGDCGEDDNSMLGDCRDAIGLGLAANGFASRFFKKGGRMGGVLEIPAAMSPKGKGKLEEGWRKTYERNDGQFATVILRDNAKFHSAQFDPDKGQMTLSRQEQVKEIARILNLPAHKLGHDGRTAYNSLEMEERAYLNSCLSHWFHAIQSECNLKLLTSDEDDAMSHEFSHDISELIATDSETTANVHKTYIEMGAKTVDEVRRELRLPPLPEQTNTMGDSEAPEPPPVDTEGDDEAEESPSERNAVRDAVGASAANRIRAAWKCTTVHVLKEVRRKKPARFLKWFDERWAEEVEQVRAACDESCEALALVEGITPDEAFGRLSEPLNELRNTLSGLMECTPADELESKIREAVGAWRDEYEA